MYASGNVLVVNSQDSCIKNGSVLSPKVLELVRKLENSTKGDSTRKCRGELRVI